jgi:hypothetical protein
MDMICCFELVLPIRCHHWFTAVADSLRSQIYVDHPITAPIDSRRSRIHSGGRFTGSIPQRCGATCGLSLEKRLLGSVPLGRRKLSCICRGADEWAEDHRVTAQSGHQWVSDLFRAQVRQHNFLCIQVDWQHLLCDISYPCSAGLKRVGQLIDSLTSLVQRKNGNVSVSPIDQRPRQQPLQ